MKALRKPRAAAGVELVEVEPPGTAHREREHVGAAQTGPDALQPGHAGAIGMAGEIGGVDRTD